MWGKIRKRWNEPQASKKVLVGAISPQVPVEGLGLQKVGDPLSPPGPSPYLGQDLEAAGG